MTSSSTGLLVVALIIAGCGPHPARGGAFLTVERARARVLKSGAGVLYFEVQNRGPIPDRLERVDVPSASDAQLHEVIEADGVSQMRPAPDGFSIPPFATLRLEHGGKHVMLFGVHPTSQRLRAIARFRNADAITFDAALGDGSST